MSEPSQKTKNLVDLRDGNSCVRCGHWLPGNPGGRHHRKKRSQCSKAEKHQVYNVVDICGTGTTGCHGWVHSHMAESYALGYLVHGYADPREVPIKHFRYGWCRLDVEGGFERLSSDEIKELEVAA
jgi:hypothetical protein